MREKNLTLLIFVLLAASSFAQKQLKIVSELDDTYQLYQVKVRTTNWGLLAEYTIDGRDTTLVYTFGAQDSLKNVYVCLYSEPQSKDYSCSNFPLSVDSAVTVYHLKPVRKKDFSEYNIKPGRIKFSDRYPFFQSGRVWAGTAAWALQNQSGFEFGLTRTSIDIPTDRQKRDGQYLFTFAAYTYSTIAADIIFKPEVAVAPKIGIGFNYLFLDVSANITGYNHLGNFDWAITPEMGLSVFGVGVTYGYNFYLEPSDTFGKSTHRVTFRYMRFWDKSVEERKKRRNKKAL